MHAVIHAWYMSRLISRSVYIAIADSGPPRTAIYWSYTVSFLPIKCNDSLTITPLLAYSAVEKLTFIKFSKKTGFDISCKLSTLYFEMLSAEIFTQHAKCACIVLVKELKLLYTLS